MRRIATLLCVAAMTAALVVLPTISASAEGIPATALGDCSTGSGGGGDRGGWDIRTFAAYGSTDTDPTPPVRPRTTTLLEPCEDSGKWAVPVQLTETPPIDDHDPEDPANQPGPGSTGPCTDYVESSGTIPYTSIDWTPKLVGCNKPVFYLNSVGNSGLPSFSVIDNSMTFGTPALTNSNRTVTVTLTGSYPTSGYGSTGQIIISMRVICKNTTTSVITTQAQSNQFNAAAAPTESKVFVFTCASGSTAIAAVNASSNAGDSYARYGVFWRGDHAAESDTPGLVGGYQSSVSTLGENSSIGGVVGSFTCSTTRTGSEFTIPINSRYTFGDPGVDTAYDWGLPVGATTEDLEWSRVDLAFLGSSATVAACPYLVRIDTSWCGYSAGISSCINFAWSYAKFAVRAPYDDGTPDEWNCEYWDAQACDPINFPEYVDYALYANACPNPPEPAWLDFSWIPATIGYHVECLFVPQGGSDARGDLALAWEGSTAGQIGELVTELGDAFSYGETCGVIVPATQYVPIAIDSCEWSWATGARDMLTIAMWVAFALWAVWFVAQIILGFVNKKSPNPVAQDAAGD